MDDRSFRGILRSFFAANSIIGFVVASLSLSIVGAASFQIIANIFGTSTSAMGIILVIAALILIIAALFTWRVVQSNLERKNRNIVKLDRKQPAKHRGLIVLVSRKAAPEKAYQWHLPVLEHCWLVHSAWEDSKAAAVSLKQDIDGLGKNAERIEILDVLNPEECFDKVDDIYKNKLPKGFSESDVILDFTGMTVTASVGAMLACLSNEHRHIQYTAARRVDGKEVSDDPVEIILEWDVVRRTQSTPAADPQL